MSVIRALKCGKFMKIDAVVLWKTSKKFTKVLFDDLKMKFIE